MANRPLSVIGHRKFASAARKHFEDAGSQVILRALWDGRL